MVLDYIYVYIFLCLFVCLQRNPTCSASHLQGCRWDSSIHSRTVFQLNLLFAPEILAVLSRMEASLIQVFLFPQRILRGMDGRRIFFKFLFVYNILRNPFELIIKLVIALL